MRILEEVIHTFKENDRVSVVAGSESYRGKHSGRMGTVKYVYEEKRAVRNIAVALDDINNDASSKGLFYFKESDLRGCTHKEREIAEMKSMSICVEAIKVMEELTLELNAFENKGENKNMKSEKILNLWEMAGIERIGEEASREHEALVAADPTYAQLQRHVAEIDRIVTESGYNESGSSCVSNCERFIGHETKQKIAESHNKMIEKKKALYCVVEEIAAMLSACDTYEQEMDVLRTYGVIGEDGRLNNFFDLIYNNKT